MASKQGFSHLNLLPKDSFEFSPSGKFLNWATTIGRVLVIMTEFVVLLAFGSRFYFDKKINDLTELSDQKQAQIVAFADTEETIRTVISKQDQVESYLSSNIKFSERYTSLTRLVPAGVKLDTLAIDSKNITMQGEANSELGFAQFLGRLKKIDGVTKIDLKNTNFDQQSGSVKFSIQTVFK